MLNPVQTHYQNYPYPTYPLIASVRCCDTYALSLTALWARFNGTLPPTKANRILIAGSGTFAPYTCAVANPHVPITALDLSTASLKRARWHCLLHLKNNISYRCGDLTDPNAIDGDFGLIDSFGVLHHLENPLAGLKVLEKHLLDGGILRIMLYSRYARREEESIRRALRLLGVDSPNKARLLLKKAVLGSRLANYLNAADEPTTTSGIADALLHPRVHTYRIDELKEMLDQTDLQILMFAHPDALEEPKEEIKRLKNLEKSRLSPGNFVIYLGKNCSRQTYNIKSGSMIQLNPCLVSAVNPLKLGTLQINRRIGIVNPPLTYKERTFLRKFVTPIQRSKLSSEELKQFAIYKRLLFLIEYTAF